MLTQKDLLNTLKRIDGKGYGAYKDLQGQYQFDNYILFIDHVQSDPFAPPSRIRIRVDNLIASIPLELFSTKVRKIALEDYFTRQIANAIKKNNTRISGTGKSGLIAILPCAQEILERTSVVICEKYIEARISVGLPARGRTVMAKEAEKLFFTELPQIVNRSMLFKNIDGEKAKRQVELAEDQEYLRKKLEDSGIVAFIGNGSILPRESGVSDRPLKGKEVVPFESPKELEVCFELPNRGKIKGMAIKKGVTLIVGGGYHGKSTLLKAIERGIYNHIEGDGREFVITCESAVKIRAEDGRFIQNVDISPFINNLPGKQDTRHFSTQNASGSTSQAANIIEAVEAGCRLLLLDEDTSATNFMIRDARMQRLVHKDKEPITPFIDRVRQFHRELDISTIVVIGGSGDYFDVADTVILMDEYRPREVTAQAKKIAKEIATNREKEFTGNLSLSIQRIPLAESFEIKARKEKVKSKGTMSIVYGYNEIDLQSVEQLVDSSQTAAIALMMQYIKKKNLADGRTPLKDILVQVYEEISQKRLDIISPFYGQHPGDYSMPRIQEVFAAINRLSTLKIVHREGSQS
ncbi:MAG: ABC-ATPase domain-containing protein [Clostridiaceae bacterium]|nr:ABC-ATPase domain-containing protein [Clostridiaceae bacterium]